MPTNNYPGIGYTTHGVDFNFFKKIAVSTTSFGGGSVDGYQPDCVITFSSQSLILIIEPTGSNKVVEFSFNGTTVHGELDGTSTSYTSSLNFENRVVSKIWLRMQQGSTGPVNVSIYAWGKP